MFRNLPEFIQRKPGQPEKMQNVEGNLKDMPEGTILRLLPDGSGYVLFGSVSNENLREYGKIFPYNPLIDTGFTPIVLHRPRKVYQ